KINSLVVYREFFIIPAIPYRKDDHRAVRLGPGNTAAAAFAPSSS
ncbi:hypothetical protein TNCV_1269531, partial [Trichonephila clavipes]